MQAKTVGLGVVVALSSLPLSGKVAEASSCSKYSSYIQLARGECVNLSYMTKLGASRSRVRVAAREYNRAVSASVNDPVTTTVVESIGNTNVSYVYTTSYALPPAEKQRLQKQAAQRGKEYLSASAANRKTEDWAYQQHRQALSQVSRGMATPRAEYTDRYYIQSSR